MVEMVVSGVIWFCLFILIVILLFLVFGVIVFVKVYLFFIFVQSVVVLLIRAGLGCVKKCGLLDIRIVG